jgi:hypothetical protein
MKPRVFVSSTYYDLKHIRNNLENFIESFGFEPVLFESGTVTFALDKVIDESCYEEVKLCHMMILIIGGRYGSPASEDNEDKVKKYEENYISITRKEFITALENNIPVYIFIEKNVDSEHHTYKKNKDFFENIYAKKIEENNSNFNFAHVDNINVFKFIDEVKIRPVHTFEKFVEIESYLRNQWAGIYYLYLKELQDKKKSDQILNSVGELKNISQQMNKMLGEVGKHLIGGTDEYREVIKDQRNLIIKLFSEKLLTSTEFTSNVLLVFDDDEEPLVEQSAEIIIEHYLENEYFKEVMEQESPFLHFDEKITTEIINTLNGKLRKIVTISGNQKKPALQIKRVNHYLVIPSYYREIKPIITEDFTYKEELTKMVTYQFGWNGI